MKKQKKQKIKISLIFNKTIKIKINKKIHQVNCHNN